MPYTIEWEKWGVIKRFTGEVIGREVVESEEAIMGHQDFTDLRYVVSDYLRAQTVAFTPEERMHLRAIRIGAYYSNPRIRFAFITQDPEIRRNLASSVEAGDVLHEVQVFDTVPAAMRWATSEG